MKKPFLMIILLLLSACGLVSERKADELYVLKAPMTAGASGMTIPLSVQVAAPSAAPGLDTTRIAVLETPNHLTYYNGVAWARALPLMVQDFLVDSLEVTHQFKSVSNDDQSIYADIIVATDIRDCEVDKSHAASTVTIRMVASIIDANSHKIITSFPVEKTIPVDAHNIAGIVAAFNKAMIDATADIVARVTATGAELAAQAGRVKR